MLRVSHHASAAPSSTAATPTLGQVGRRRLIGGQCRIHAGIGRALDGGRVERAAILEREQLLARRRVDLAPLVEGRQQRLPFRAHYEALQFLVDAVDVRAVRLHLDVDTLAILRIHRTQPRFGQRAVDAGVGEPAVGQAGLVDRRVHVGGRADHMLQTQGADHGQHRRQCEHGGEREAEPGPDFEILDIHVHLDGKR
jgi:hypothetical protein